LGSSSRVVKKAKTDRGGHLGFEAKLWLEPCKVRIYNPVSDMKTYDTLLKRAVDSLAATFRQRAASGLQSGCGFVLPSTHEQVHEKTDLELVTWLVIKDGNAD